MFTVFTNRCSLKATDMAAPLICCFFWILALVGETAAFSVFSWIQPNLLFLFSTLFCLHWRGNETHFIAVWFGLTADCFSTIPFGVFGLSFFLFSFLSRWYAIKIFQETAPTAIVVTAVFTVGENVLAFVLLDLFFDWGLFNLIWLRDMLLMEMLPTAILVGPSLSLLRKFERRYRIRLAERKF